MKCYPWTYKDKIDRGCLSCYRAFYGQGMNAGFEDISILRNDGGIRDDWEMIFQNKKSRKPADAIAELSYRNFMEMSSKTADDKFYCRRRLKNGFR
jgi:kynurenine 3-monooxygenase